MYKNQHGNALWFILLAVFLLGALTVVLMRGSGNTEETGDTERASIKASEMLRYTSGMSQVVERLIMSGCSENDISFYSTQWTDNGYTYDNPNSPFAGGNFKCHVFHKNGGGYPFKTIPSGISSVTDYYITGRNEVMGVGPDATGGEGDLMLIAPKVTREVCAAINRSLDVQSFAKDGVETTLPFLGAYTPQWGLLGDDNINPAYVEGKKAFCMESINYSGMVDGDFFFVQVLHVR